jgi:hypothetical protein
MTNRHVQHGRHFSSSLWGVLKRVEFEGTRTPEGYLQWPRGQFRTPDVPCHQSLFGSQATQPTVNTCTRFGDRRLDEEMVSENVLTIDKLKIISLGLYLRIIYGL